MPAYAQSAKIASTKIRPSNNGTWTAKSAPYTYMPPLVYTETVRVVGSTIQNSANPKPARVVMALSCNSALVFEGDLTSITSSGEPASHLFSARSRSSLTHATSAPQTSFSGSGRYGYSVSTMKLSG